MSAAGYTDSTQNQTRNPRQITTSTWKATSQAVSAVNCRTGSPTKAAAAMRMTADTTSWYRSCISGQALDRLVVRATRMMPAQNTAATRQ